MAETHVYLIVEDGTDFVKIGIADRPNIRIGTLQTGNPRQIFLHVTYPFPTRQQAVIAERRMHEHFMRTRAHGEWFCTDVDAAHQVLGGIWMDILGLEKAEKCQPRLVVANG